MTAAPASSRKEERPDLALCSHLGHGALLELRDLSPTVVVDAGYEGIQRFVHSNRVGDRNR